MAKHLVYDEVINAVFISGAANPINPDTNIGWASKEEAEEFIANYPAPVPPTVLTLVVTEVRNALGVVELQQPFNLNLVVLTEGDVAEVDIEIQDGNGNVIANPAFDMTFTLPVVGMFGSSMKVVDIDFIDGLATASVSFPEQGMWQVKQDHVNMHIENPEGHFVFDGIDFKVKQSTI